MEGGKPVSLSKQGVRGHMVSEMVAMGWPEDRAATCVDLAIHAAEEANSRLDEITAAAPDLLVGTQALVLAANILLRHYENATERLRSCGFFEEQETMQ